ncbi:MAG TPA: sulfurtransferase TusA family protein [Candidatus Eisenbacteria bacterium]|nr:sulfurtransferase TusA family protein [Candidatus Eisenbacteria bacterium]
MTEENSSHFKASYQLDCSWQLCPVPILMTEEKLSDLGCGEVLEVIFTDPGARPDLEAWCDATGNPLLGFRECAEAPRLKSSAFVRRGASWKK